MERIALKYRQTKEIAVPMGMKEWAQSQRARPGADSFSVDLWSVFWHPGIGELAAASFMLFYF